MTPQAYFSILSRMPPKYSLWKFVFPSIDRLKVSLADRHIQKFLPQRKLKLAMSLLIASSAHSIRKKSQNEREKHTKQNSCAGYWLLNFIFCWFFVCVYFYLKKAKKKKTKKQQHRTENEEKNSFQFHFRLNFRFCFSVCAAAVGCIDCFGALGCNIIPDELLKVRKSSLERWKKNFWGRC